MGDRLDKRKNAFKAKNLSSTDRIRKESEQARKDKRSTNVLAKRLRADPAAIDDNTVVYTEAAVNEAIAQLKSGDHVVRVQGLRMLREILCSTHSNIELIVSSGTPVFLSSVLASPNEEVRVEAAWCLTNIATGDHEQTGSVLCAVPYMVEILSSSRDSVELKEQICWALGNIAGDCDEYRTVLHGNGCLAAALKFLAECTTTQGHGQIEEPHSGFRTAAWTLSNLARGTVSGQVFQATGQLPQLMHLMDSQRGREGAEEMWWLFAFLTAKEDAVVAHCIEQGLVKILTTELSKCSVSSLSNIPLIRCLGNITSGPIEWMDSITSRPALMELLLQRIAYSSSVSGAGEGHVHKLVAKETLWVVCNILGALPHQRKAFLLHNTTDAHPCIALEHLLTVLQCDEYDVQQEGVFCLEQACADEDLLQLLLTSPVYRPHLLPLARQTERLLRSPSCDVPLSCMRIVSALTSAAKSGSGSSSGEGGLLSELVNMWVEAGITEALDDIQYSGGAASADSEGGRRVSEGAAALVEQLYAILENEENADTAESNTSNANAFASTGGVPAPHYSFGAPAAPTVFSFGPAPGEASASPAVQGNEGLGPGLGSGARQAGVGRGSHLNKPSWMS